MRLIDRDELMSVISEIKSVVEFDGPIDEVHVKGEKYEKVRHGKWIDSSNGWMCTCCGMDTSKDYNYCPNCGAKMDGGEE